MFDESTARYLARVHIPEPLVARIGRVAASIALLAMLPAALDAQRRPGVGMGFYTYTGLLTADVEGGSVSTTSGYAEAPTFAISAHVTAPLVKFRKSAWIVGVRGTPLSLGNGNACLVLPGESGCQSRRFEERVGLLTGGAFDIRETMLRVMAGPTLYDVEDTGARIGTTLRVDFSAPRLRGPTPTLFLTRTFLGNQRGEALGLTTLGAGFRWVRKR